MAGYSQRSLAQKLGVKEGATLVLLDAPDGIEAILEPLPAAVGEGTLWMAWPKRASGVETDLSEDVIRDLALAGGMVDSKVCAIDETWSGLRLTRRRA
ncbi:MAG TPA: hypothetical protein VNR67_01270 [Solirubrobacterales bacterium]|nr:hypothetical protein [Solirubrobacterales bacterium]